MFLPDNFPKIEDIQVLTQDYVQLQMRAHHDPPSVLVMEASFQNFWNRLSASQRSDYANKRVISLVGNVSGTVYWIACGASYVGNVYALSEKGEAVTSFCCYPKHTQEVATAWLGQKLAIETNEKYWLTKAVQHGHFITVPGVVPEYPALRFR